MTLPPATHLRHGVRAVNLTQPNSHTNIPFFKLLSVTLMPSPCPSQSPKLKIRVDCCACNLNRICLPSGMPPDEIDSLSDIVRRDRPLRKGESIYHAGERFSGIFALKSGAAKLVHTDHFGNESIIAVLLPGELLGFDGLASGRYLCSLIVLEASRYCELPSHRIEQISQRMPSLYQVLLQRTGEQFDQSIEKIAISQRPADERLAAFLLDLAKRYGARGFSSEQFQLSLTRQEIGNHLGLALETVSRALGKFEAAGMIGVRGKQIHILDAELLRRCNTH